MRKNYYWIDGLKGIACLIVATNHIYNLFPSSRIPALFYNGGFMVGIFILLSIILASISVFRRLDRGGGTASIECAEYVISRYVSLFLPVLVIILMVLCAYHFGSFSQFQNAMAITKGGDPSVNYSPEVMTLRHAIKVSLLAPVVGNSHFVFPIWMLPHIFWGNMTALIKCILVRHMNFKKMALFCAATGIFEWYLMDDPIRMLSSVGVFVGYILYYCEDKIQVISKTWLSNVIGIVFWTYSIISCEGLLKPIDKFDPATLGVILTVAGLVLSNVLQKVFSLKWLVQLGKISMGVYYVHQPLTTSFCCFLFLLLYRYGNITVSKVGTYILFYVMILFAGFFYTKLTNILTNKVQARVTEFLFDNMTLSKKD